MVLELKYKCITCPNFLDVGFNKGNTKYCPECSTRIKNSNRYRKRKNNPHLFSNENHILSQVKSNPATAEMLAAFMNCRTRRIHQMICSLRKKGYHISKNGDNCYEYVGYFQ